MNDLRLKRAARGSVEFLHKPRAVRKKNRHVIALAARQTIKNLHVAIPCPHKVDLVENNDRVLGVSRPEGKKQVIEGCALGRRAQKIFEHLETAVVIAHIAVDNLNAAFGVQLLCKIPDHQRFPRAAAPKQRKILGYARMVIPQYGVNKDLGLIAHNRLGRNVAEVEDRKVLDLSGFFLDLLLPSPKIRLNIHFAHLKYNLHDA